MRDVLFILTDNLGYGDIGVYGAGEVRGAPTPRIDELARQGLRLTKLNVEPECTPTRSALMTGRMPIRSGTSKGPLAGAASGPRPVRVRWPSRCTTRATSRRRTASGHLGDKQGRMPNDRSFDEWWGFAHSSDETLNNISPAYAKGAKPFFLSTRAFAHRSSSARSPSMKRRRSAYSRREGEEANSGLRT